MAQDKTYIGNLRSIWDNDFYNKKPAAAWTYKINFNDFVVYNKELAVGKTINFITNSDMEILSKAAVSISVGERKIDQTDLYYGGLNFKKLTRVDNTGQFTVKFNENTDYAVTNVLEKLYSLYGIHKKYYLESGYVANFPYMSDMKKDNLFSSTDDSQTDKNLRNSIISVQIFDPDVTLNNNGDDASYEQYKFYNCQLIGIEGIEYNYESTDTITRNATFIYDWMQYNVQYDNPDAVMYSRSGEDE